MSIKSVNFEGVQQYLQLLSKQFERNLMRLSGTGVGLSADRRITLMLSQSDALKDRERGYATCSRYGADLATGAQEDLKLLKRWSKSQRDPLLLIAPFGSGKSILLASFAIELAQLAIRQIAQKDHSKLLIPWPVRLRDWLSYRAEHPKSGFKEFMWSSPATLLMSAAEGSIPPNTVSFRVFEAILSAGLLVPLFDGFDELPDDLAAQMESVDGLPSRREALNAIRECCGRCGYVLSSRPGVLGNPVDAGFSEQNQHVLDELGPDEISAYVEQRFKNQPSLLEKAMAARDRPGPKVARLLRRPLFLMVWCDAVRTDISEPPSRLEDLMTLLMLHCFDGRRKETKLRQAEVRRILPHLASLIYLHAVAGFGSIVGDTALRELLRAHHCNIQEKDLLKLRALGIAAGLLGEAGATASYAFKIPVNEFLVAYRLTALADGTATTAQRRLAVNIFRRWVWLPNLHDTLDMFFAMLDARTGESDNSSRRFGQDCIQWLVNVSAAEPSRNPSIDPPACDDLERPFIITAHRWNCQFEMRSAMFDRIESEFVRIFHRWEHLRRTVDSLVNAYNSDPETEDEKRAWKDAIKLAPGSMKKNQVGGIVEKLIKLSRAKPTRDGVEMDAWSNMISAAARRIWRPQERQQLFQTLLDIGWNKLSFKLALGDQAVTIVSLIRRNETTNGLVATGKFHARLRSDPKLLLDEYLVAVPARLASILKDESLHKASLPGQITSPCHLQNQEPSANPETSYLPPDEKWLLVGDVEEAVLAAVKVSLGENMQLTFAEFLGTSAATRGRRVRDVVAHLEKYLKQKEDREKFKRFIILKDESKRLEINPILLSKLLEKNSDALTSLCKLVSDDPEAADPRLYKLRAGRYPCPICGAYCHPLRGVRWPEQCEACEDNTIQGVKPLNLPEEHKHCPKCVRDYATGKWKYTMRSRIEKHDKCPACGAILERH